MAVKAAPPPPPAAASTGNLVSADTSVVTSVPGGCTVLLITGTIVSGMDCARGVLGVSKGNMVSVPRMTSVREMNSKVFVSEGGDCLKEFVKI